MSKRWVLVIGALSAVLAVVIAFVAGIYVGVDQYLLISSTTEASLRVGELRALRASRNAALIQTKELELDTQLLLYSRYKAQGQPWIFWPFSESFDHERHLRTIAAYRKEFPPVLPAIADASTGADSPGQTVRQVTDEILRTYGPR
jgi:hypothetical protein